ncbi:MAG: hypothetical protein HY055_05575 [Magnetospirillum sp.]|nr:hypothetical protein [Magnetospirillum sp.]
MVDEIYLRVTDAVIGNVKFQDGEGENSTSLYMHGTILESNKFKRAIGQRANLLITSRSTANEARALDDIERAMDITCHATEDHIKSFINVRTNRPEIKFGINLYLSPLGRYFSFSWMTVTFNLE